MKKMKFTMLLALGFLLAGAQFATAQEDKKEVKKTKQVIEVDDNEMQIETETEIKRKDIKEKPTIKKENTRPKSVSGEGAAGVIEVKEIELEDDDDNDKNEKLKGKLVDEL